jgi:hypothetical protein
MNLQRLLIALVTFALASSLGADPPTTNPTSRPSDRPTSTPVAAIWHDNRSSNRPPDPHEEVMRLVVAVWSDGTIVWSEHGRKGGRPYLTANVREARVKQLLSDLKEAGFFRELKRTRWFGPDSGYMVIAANDGSDCQRLASWHDGRESVTNQDGIHALRAGEKLPPPSTDAWEKGRELILIAIPKDGQSLDNVDMAVYEKVLQSKRP